MPNCTSALRTYAVVAIALMASPSLAQMKGASTTQANGPQRTFVGLYINDISGLDLKKSSYSVDFYLWMRWQGVIDPSDFEFLNGSLDMKEHPNTAVAPGSKYVSYHCRGSFHADFDYHRYPLDEHQLEIEIEDGNNEAAKLKYIVDRENMGRLPAPILPGWTCSKPRVEIREHMYETNFGDPMQPSDATATYSRLYCSIRISRHSFSIYMKTFLALFISVAIAFLSFMLKPGESDPRFGVGLAAIFGAVSSYIVVTSNLPDMPYLTLADKIHLFSLFIIFLSLLQSCLSLRLLRHGNAARAYRIDRISLFVFPVCYAVVISALTVMR